MSIKQKLVIAHMPFGDQDRLATVLFEDNRAVELYVNDPGAASIMNNVYVGHVERVLPQSGGAFVRFGKDMEGFLPLGRCRRPVFRNVKNNTELKAEDELLVFVETEAMKTKLPGLSTEIKLTGKYLIISNESEGLSFSRKLSKEEKELLKEGLEELESDYGFIVRTQAGQAKIEDVLEEGRRLEEKLKNIIRYGVLRPSGSCIYQSEEIWSEKLKGLKAPEEIVTDDMQVYETILSSEALSIEDRSRVRLYDDKMLKLYRLNNFSAILDNASARVVRLKSGASLIIEQTEAFVCIDVNSAKSVRKKADDETFLKINLEAAREAARQIRLRQLSGTILIDFINMEEKSFQDKLMETMKALVKRDTSNVNVIDITKLGIMELTRKKKGRSLAEQAEIR